MKNGGWTVAHTKDLTPAQAGHDLHLPPGTSFAEASQALDEHLAGAPDEAGTWQVVERHEVTA
jgi:hypothetical protein